MTQQRGELRSFGTVTALWTSSGAVVAVMENLNPAYGAKEGTPIWKVWGLALLLVLGLSGLVIVSLAFLIFGPQMGGPLAQRIGLGVEFVLIWNIVRWLITLLFLIVAMANIYYFAPDIEQKWKWITPGRYLPS